MKTEFTITFLLISLLWFPSQPAAEFYKYTDENGQVHFVDDKSKIPVEHTDKLEVFKERYDGLSEEEKAELMSMTIGPYNIKRPHITIIEHKGKKLNYDGLLGMDFLRHVRYTIDYQNGVIRWQP